MTSEQKKGGHGVAAQAPEQTYLRRPVPLPHQPGAMGGPPPLPGIPGLAPPVEPLVLPRAVQLAADFDLTRLQAERKGRSLHVLLVRAAAIAVAEAFGRADLAIVYVAAGAVYAPVLRAAETYAPVDLEREVASLASRARSGALTDADQSGATLVLLNAGRDGAQRLATSHEGSSPPLLAVGAADARPVVRDGLVLPGATLSATLSFERSGTDPAVAARLLRTFGRVLEDVSVLA